MAISIQTAIGDPCTISKIYKWNYRTERFSEYQSLSLIGAKKFLFFKEGGDNFLFVATMGKSCVTAGEYKTKTIKPLRCPFHLDSLIKISLEIHIASFGILLSLLSVA